MMKCFLRFQSLAPLFLLIIVLSISCQHLKELERPSLRAEVVQVISNTWGEWIEAEVKLAGPDRDRLEYLQGLQFSWEMRFDDWIAAEKTHDTVIAAKEFADLLSFIGPLLQMEDHLLETLVCQTNCKILETIEFLPKGTCAIYKL